MAYHHNLSAKSAEDLLKGLLNVSSTPDPPVRTVLPGNELQLHNPQPRQFMPPPPFMDQCLESPVLAPIPTVFPGSNVQLHNPQPRQFMPPPPFMNEYVASPVPGLVPGLVPSPVPASVPAPVLTVRPGSKLQMHNPQPRQFMPPPPFMNRPLTSPAIYSIPYSFPSAPPPPQQQGQEPQTIPYEDYLAEIPCFTPGNHPQADSMLRDYIHALCRSRATNLHLGTLRLAKPDIPSGRWTCAFAPAILESGAWMLAFAAPDSEFVWLFWPEDAGESGESGESGGSEKMVVRFLQKLVREGKMRAEMTMKVGDERHVQFHAMAAQAVWADNNQGVLDMDWRVGEFRGVI